MNEELKEKIESRRKAELEALNPTLQEPELEEFPIEKYESEEDPQALTPIPKPRYKHRGAYKTKAWRQWKARQKEGSKRKPMSKAMGLRLTFENKTYIDEQPNKSFIINQAIKDYRLKEEAQREAIEPYRKFIYGK